MQPELSIIIPTYNSKAFIDNVMNYFKRNRDERFEVIFVDDCSKDGTYEYLKNMESMCGFKMVVARNENNVGPGLTRNKGIQEAKGRYITFMDSDDMLSDDFFTEIFSILEEQNYDTIVFDAFICSERDDSRNYYSMFSTDVQSGKVDKKRSLVFVKGCTWGKVYKRDLIVNNRIEFLNIKRNEDMPFTKKCVESSDAIFYLKRPLYLYKQNCNSLMHNKSLLDARNTYAAFEYLSKNISKDFHEEMEAIFLLEYLYSTVLTKALELNRKELLRYIRETEELYPNCYNNSYLNSYGAKYRITIFLIQKKCLLLIKILANIRSR